MSPSSLAPRPLPSPPASRHVAVIGAGLAAARELRREGHRVGVFERSAAVGGTWIYTPTAESDALGLDSRREVVHSSLYDSLRTNLPRECMGFLDYPFSSAAPAPAAIPGGSQDTARFSATSRILQGSSTSTGWSGSGRRWLWWRGITTEGG
ncbi:unnamed protein product [Musa textilis]